jgi:transcriptional regulator with XRE-family HTH domain
VTSAASLVRQARTRAGLTQAKLAALMGTTQSAVARLERPGSNPTVATLQSALHATGHSLGLSAGTATGIDETQIVELLRLTPRERLGLFQRNQHNQLRLLRRARRVE